MHTSIRTLLLFNFQEINETGNLEYLLESNDEKHTPDELMQAYETILDEYDKAIGNDVNNQKYTLRTEIRYLYTKMNNLLSLVSILDSKDMLDDDVIEEAKKICKKYRTSFTYEKLEWSLSGVQNKLKIKLKELERASNDNGTSFDDYFISVCSAYGQKVNKRETTVSEWCSIVKSVKKKAENA